MNVNGVTVRRVARTPAVAAYLHVVIGTTPRYLRLSTGAASEPNSAASPDLGSGLTRGIP
jgi:hypothetical protein